MCFELEKKQHVLFWAYGTEMTSVTQTVPRVTPGSGFDFLLFNLTQSSCSLMPTNTQLLFLHKVK